MRKEIKGFVTGVLITGMVMSGGALASGMGIEKAIKVVFSGANFMVNGQSIENDNLIYQGKTYVAVRNLAQILDKNVDWKATTKTVIINDPKEGSVKVNAKEIKSEDEALIVDLKIPVIEGMRDVDLQNKINSNFEKDIMDFRKTINQEAQLWLEESKKTGSESQPNGPYWASVDYNVSYNQDNLLSISLTYWQYTGGAHGDYVQVTSNIDLTTGKIISLKDMVKPGTNYENIIIGEIKKQMEKAPENYFEESTASIAGVFEQQNFYLVGGGLVFYYNTYEIAPYAAGIVEFKIPVTLLKDVINTDAFSR